MHAHKLTNAQYSHAKEVVSWALLLFPLLQHFVALLQKRFRSRNNGCIVLAFVFLAIEIKIIVGCVIRAIDVVVIAVSIFMFSHFMMVLGATMRLPAYVAGWAPAFIVALAGAVMLARMDEA